MKINEDFGSSKLVPKNTYLFRGGLYRPQNETYYRAKRGLSGEIRISPADAFLGKKKARNIRTS